MLNKIVRRLFLISYCSLLYKSPRVCLNTKIKRIICPPKLSRKIVSTRFGIINVQTLVTLKQNKKFHRNKGPKLNPNV